MTSPSFNYFYRVELTVVRLGDQIQSGTQTIRTKVSKTYNFVSKSLRDAVTPSDRETMLPILEAVGEVSLNAGEFLPSTSFSSISILNYRGSFGADRRFSDVLERYTAINQTINFYVGQSDNFTDMPASWQQIASGQVQSWSTAIGGQDPTISFQIAPYKISDRVMNLEISRDIVGMENAPDSSLGVALPIVLNKIHHNQVLPLASYPQVIPTRISADGAETAKYALCTLMYQKTKARVMTNYYVKKPWETDANVWTPISFTRQADSYLSPPVPAAVVSLNQYAALAAKIPEHAAGSNASGFITTGVTFLARGAGSVGRVSNAYLSAFILRVNRNTYSVVDEVARGKAALATYDSQNNLGSGYTFNVTVSFNSPAVVELMADRSNDFYIGYEVTNYSAGGDMNFYVHPTSTPTIAKVQGATESNDWKIILPTPSTIVCHQLDVVTATANVHESTYSKDGFTYASLTLSQPAPDTGQTNPPLDSLGLVALVEGFNDYTTNNRIKDAYNALYYFSLEWNGEAWVDVNAVDISTLYSSHYLPLLSDNAVNTQRSRYLTGIFDTKVTYSQVITEIARGSAAKIGIFSSKKLFIYPWGITAAPAFNIPQADIIPLSWEMRDPSTVMNRTSIAFDKIYAIEESMDSGDGYAYAIDFSSPDYLPVQQITEESRALYGVQNIVENKFNVFGYSDYYAGVGVPGYLTGGPSNSQPVVGGTVVFSVDFLAEYYMTRFALPAVYCSFVIPWHRYNSIKMFDVITFAHSEFPAFYGTDPSARPGVVISGSNTTPVPNAGYGQELTRAQTYRGLVEGISYVMAMEHAPAIRLTVLVLLNREFDPT